mmetsp:Transcript_5286/g.12102  ORF Transcript_5286/g.12102 Transcript_5286/m.12102 type:complete len:226 (+) Transcript_5286:419-1096(+)
MDWRFACRRNSIAWRFRLCAYRRSPPRGPGALPIEDFVLVVGNMLEIRGVVSARERWHVHWLGISDELPFDVLEKRRFLDVGSTACSAEPRLRVPAEETFDHFLAILGDRNISWEHNLKVFARDVRERGVLRFSLERCVPKRHFVAKDAERPPINRAVVTDTTYDLRGKILFSANERIGIENWFGSVKLHAVSSSGEHFLELAHHRATNHSGSDSLRLLGEIKVR